MKGLLIFCIIVLITNNCYFNPLVNGLLNPKESKNDPILWMMAMVGLNNSGGNANVSGSDNSENENSENPTISYSNTNLVFTRNTVIPNITPSVTGTPLTNCNSSPNLPEGLSINDTTCMISGTPTTTQSVTNYIITASNSFGTGTTEISIAINSVGIAPTIIYSGSPFSIAQGSAISTISPSLGGNTPTTCIASPALPTGLLIDPTSCAISGTPTIASTQTSYTITATNDFGSGEATISIAVIAPVVQPTFSPGSGYYTTPQNISISTTTSGATIHYTIDGTDPTTSSPVYTEPIPIWSIAGRTIKAMGVKSGSNNSGIATSGIYSYPPLKTGQNQCWNASGTPISCSGTGQDGESQFGVARSYIDNDNGTITDNATGLLWQKCSMGQNNDESCSGTATTAIWVDAGTNCSGLSLASRTWRLPSRQELETLPDFSRSSPAIDTTAFPATFANNYWSFTSYAPNTASAWRVYFFNGDVYSLGKTANSYVRCISGPSKEYSSSFTDNSDGTVKDNATGLVWQKCSRGQNNDETCSGTATTATWTVDITYCSGLTLASRTWRLPTINELKTIVDTTKASGAAIDTTAFPATVAGDYWSSTTYAQSKTNAWVVFFSNGNVNFYGKASSGYVRCVSGP